MPAATDGSILSRSAERVCWGSRLADTLAVASAGMTALESASTGARGQQQPLLLRCRAPDMTP